ncbi:MAG: BLUF domain-containing protein [Anaerolineae bacterium]|jgi:hypothetical protein|nr:BLUF domain-containing protein [Anaerolineae bacterium]
MGLISLVYMSMSHHPMSDEELMRILEVARSHNQSHDITGMLLYRDDLFIQVMEGEDAVVLPLYEKIKTDPRHHHVLEVYQGSIEKRAFGQWAMGFNRVNDADFHDIPGFTEYLENNSEQAFFTDHPNRAIQFLEAFKNHAYF